MIGNTGLTWAQLIIAAACLLHVASCAATAWRVQRRRGTTGALASTSTWGLLLGLLVTVSLPALAGLSGFWATGALGLLAAPFQVWTWFSVLRDRADAYEAELAAHAPCGCGWYDRSVLHDYVVTSPPGFGTVFSPCNQTGRTVSEGYAVPLGTGQDAVAELRGGGVARSYTCSHGHDAAVSARRGSLR